MEVEHVPQLGNTCT